MKAAIILGDKSDFHAQHMLESCRTAGIPALMFNSASFPKIAGISWDPGCSRGKLHLHDKAIKFSEIGSVFWSTLYQSGTAEQLHAEQLQIAISDTSSMLRTFLEESSFNWVNSWHVFQFHKVKPRQLSLAAQCGVKIPSTYIGNDASEILSFVGSRGRCIYKPVYGGAHTAPLTPDLLDATHLERVLKLSPVTIQQFIPGTNIRTFVINNRVFSAEIQSEFIDFRIDNDVSLIPFKTPQEVAIAARKVTSAFGMKWTAIDWRRDLTGQYYFLEANPSPMFTHFERCTAYPITELLLDLLRVE